MTAIETIVEDLKNFAPREIEAIAKAIHERARARQIQNVELFEETENQIAIERDKEMDAGTDVGITLRDSMELVHKALNEDRLK